MNKKIIVGSIFCMLLFISVFNSAMNVNNTTVSGLLADPPYPPSNPDPSNESTDVDVNADFSWDGGDPDSGDLVYYDIYIDNGMGTHHPDRIGPFPADQIRITYDPGKLNYNTQYYWRIVAWDDTGLSTNGPVWNFITADDNPPYQPSNPSPADGAIDVDVNADLSWTGGDPDGDPVVYDVYFGTDSNPPNVVMGQSSTSYTLGTLEYDTVYYWRIDAWDEYGYSTTGNVWSFTTEEFINNPPNQPTRPSGSTNGYTDTTYWYHTSATDPDGDKVSYRFRWDDGTYSQWSPFYNSGITAGTYHSWSNPGVYNISAQARDEYYEQSIWSENLTVTITIYNDPPETPTRPTGPTYGNPGEEYSYSTVTTDPDDNEIRYYFNWGDGSGEWTGWVNSGETVTCSHIWTNTGTYEVKVRAQDEHTEKSSYSEILEVIISENSPPDKPVQPTGTTGGNVGNSYIYSSWATDPDGDKIYYLFDWGDGTDSGWIGLYNSGQTVTAAHVWTTAGSYPVKVKAKDEHGFESVWSDPLPIIMPKNKVISSQLISTLKINLNPSSILSVFNIVKQEQNLINPINKEIQITPIKSINIQNPVHLFTPIIQLAPIQTTEDEEETVPIKTISPIYQQLILTMQPIFTKTQNK